MTEQQVVFQMDDHCRRWLIYLHNCCRAVNDIRIRPCNKRKQMASTTTPVTSDTMNAQENKCRIWLKTVRSKNNDSETCRLLLAILKISSVNCVVVII